MGGTFAVVHKELIDTGDPASEETIELEVTTLDSAKE
jgi:hypothetical protein